ncbi:MAG: hypothetical protein HDS07_02575 [Bacteroides sp.]|nr:hypothetical protein [Bacteroides sp.]
MKKKFVIILMFIAASLGVVRASSPLEVLHEAVAECVGPLPADCDTIIACGNYDVRIVVKDGRPERIGLNLFSDGLREHADGSMLDYISQSLLAKALNLDQDCFRNLVITSGEIKDFRNLTPQSPCEIKSIDAKQMMVQWSVGSDDRPVCVSVPISYQNANGGASRSDIEMNFIEKIRQSKLSRNKKFPIDASDLEPYGDGLFVLAGESYINREITRNVYLSDKKKLTPVWSAEYPAESIANLLINPTGKYGNVMVELTILLHEYGEKETLTVPLERFLAVCEQEGCQAFWGVEKEKDGRVEGTLFMLNSRQGYDHVLKIEFDAAGVIDGKTPVKARASLFIPTNNVDNLFKPYRKKTQKEKIRWRTIR